MKIIHSYPLLIIVTAFTICTEAKNQEICMDGVCADECKDDHPKCELYASLQECTRNPRWMLEHCKVSCKACPRTDDMPSYEDAEEIYGPLDDFNDEEMKKLEDLALAIQQYGVAQDIRRNQGSNLAELFNETIEYMDKAQNAFSQDVLSKCKNESPFCAIWALRGKCKTNAVLSKCAPICNKCDTFLFDLDREVSKRIDKMSDEEVLLEIAKYGAKQEVDGTGEHVTIGIIKASLKYIEKVKGNVPKRCNNGDKLCAFWASEGECITNSDYMNRDCKLSCFSCTFTTGDDNDSVE